MKRIEETSFHVITEYHYPGHPEDDHCETLFSSEKLQEAIDYKIGLSVEFPTLHTFMELWGRFEEDIDWFILDELDLGEDLYKEDSNLHNKLNLSVERKAVVLCGHGYILREFHVKGLKCVAISNETASPMDGFFVAGEYESTIVELYDHLSVQP